MQSPASDEDLNARQEALQAEAADVLAGLDLAATVADIGPMLLTGSYVSGLLCSTTATNAASGHRPALSGTSGTTCPSRCPTAAGCGG